MTDDESNPLLHAVRLNAKRREERYAEHRAAGKAWLIECRDLWDAEDEDAGVYFVGGAGWHGARTGEHCEDDKDIHGRTTSRHSFSSRVGGVCDPDSPTSKGPRSCTG
jgi:hypothetical protein